MKFFLKVFIAALAALIFYGLWWEPHLLRVRQEQLFSQEGCRVKILLLSDLHLPSWNQDMNKVYRTVEKENPDYVLIAGDSRQHGHSAAASGEFISRLAERWRVIAVLGDKDVCGKYGQCLYCAQTYGPVPLNKQTYRILRNTLWVDSLRHLAIYGVDDPVSGFDDMAFTEMPDSAFFNVLLIHSTHKLSRRQIEKFDLVLAGNTHGGQVIFLKPFLKLHNEKLDQRFPGGSYRVGDARLIVSRGVGTSYVPVRLGVPPEMTVISIGGEKDD